MDILYVQMFIISFVACCNCIMRKTLIQMCGIVNNQLSLVSMQLMTGSVRSIVG
jgi:hypothetical protein